ncbi:hypothetical protein ACNQFZ_21210 [Schinkia sp. CFF1]
MKKYRKFTVLFGLFAPAFISVGMVLKDYFEYSPTVGWVGGFVFSLFALIFAVKAKHNENSLCK